MRYLVIVEGISVAGWIRRSESVLVRGGVGEWGGSGARLRAWPVVTSRLAASCREVDLCVAMIRGRVWQGAPFSGGVSVSAPRLVDMTSARPGRLAGELRMFPIFWTHFPAKGMS